MGEGKIQIDNTAYRKLKFFSLISSVIEGGRLTRADALTLRGRLQFASGQLFGRLAKKALSSVTGNAYSSRNATLDVETITALKLYLSCLESRRPRAVHRSISQVFFIFTDACFEPDSSSVKAGVAAVPADACGKVTHFFSVALGDVLVNDINKSERKTVIFELELFAILYAVIVWKQFVTNCAIVVYTDNDAVRDCLISCNTSSGNARPILDLYLKVEFESSFNAWMSRVPTDSNIADAPSCGDCKSLLSLGASKLKSMLNWCGTTCRSSRCVGEATTSNAVPHFDKKVVRVVNVKSLNTIIREVEISSLSIPNSQGVRVPVPVYVRVRVRVLVWVWVWVRIRFRVRVLVLFLFLVFLLHLLGMFQVRMAFCFCEGCFLIVCLVWVLCLRWFLQVHSLRRVPAGVLEEYWKTIRIV